MTIKMIATDMDGTLLDARGELDLPRLTAVLDQLEERDIKFVVATGNEIQRMRLLLGDLTDRMTLIVANGARIFEKNEMMLGTFWQTDLIAETLDYFHGRERDVHLVVTSTKGGFVQEGTDFPMINKVMTDEMARHFYKQMNFMPSLQNHHFEEVLKMSIMVDEAKAAEVTRQINTAFSGRLSAVTSGYGAIDIIQEGVHKAWGIRQLMDQWQIGSKEIMAFGDSENDLEMLELADFSYAMANGDEKIKCIASRWPPANTEAGVLQVIEQYLEKGV